VSISKRIPGKYEAEFMRTLLHLSTLLKVEPNALIDNARLRASFKNIMTRLFIDQHADIRVLTNNKDLKELLTDKIWEEFYETSKRTNIDTAMCIIFKRYEKK
jgi:hypothetical protein